MFGIGCAQAGHALPALSCTIYTIARYVNMSLIIRTKGLQV
jgi:hypothetical protein